MMNNLYSEVGLTAEQIAQLTMDVIEILCDQIDLNAMFRELNKRHPEFTDEQRKVLELDKTFEDGAIDEWIEEAFGSKNGLFEKLVSMYNDDEPKLQSTNETEQEGE